MKIERLSYKEINTRIMIIGVIACIFAVGVAWSAELDAVSVAERVEKLSATGILTFGFLLSIGALIYLIKLQYGKMMKVLEDNTKALVKVLEKYKLDNN